MTLSQFISENMEKILVEWEKFAATLAPIAHQKTAVLRDHAEAILRDIALDMERPQSEAQKEAKSKGSTRRDPTTVDTAAQQHGAVRFAEGLNVNEMVAEYRALRATVIRLWAAETSGTELSLHDLTRFNEEIDQALTESIATFSARVDRSRELLMGVLGHDLRNPLDAVLQSAQVLAKNPNIEGASAKAVERILRGGTRAEKLVTDLLDVARTRLGGEIPLARTAMDLRDVCRQAVDEARAHHPDRAVTLRFDGEVTGNWDQARLMQLISNLVENGLRHGGGTAAVSVEAKGEHDRVILRVHNGGVTIPAAVIHRIFDVLVQGEHPQGPEERSSSLGLGLYICRAVAEAHGGSIEVTSSEHQGTTFTVFLPRYPERQSDHETRTARSSSAAPIGRANRPTL